MSPSITGIFEGSGFRVQGSGKKSGDRSPESECGGGSQRSSLTPNPQSLTPSHYPLSFALFVFNLLANDPTKPPAPDDIMEGGNTKDDGGDDRRKPHGAAGEHIQHNEREHC
jgi:hypothetical protein